MMQLLVLTTWMLGTLIAVSRGEGGEEYNYGEYYYNYGDGEYEQKEDTKEAVTDQTNIVRNNPSQSSQPPSTAPTLHPGPRTDPEFRARVACSSEAITLSIDRTVLPQGLGFQDSLAEELARSDDRMRPACIRITHNSTHFTYKASMHCRRAVGKLRFGQKTIYTHEFLLDDIRPVHSGRPREAYSIIMDCATMSHRSRDLTEKSWIPEVRVFEHREGGACSKHKCPHGELCLPGRDVNGYFCTCPGRGGECGCPADFYGCSGGENATTRSLICVGNDQLCDKKYDCPLQDDEACGDIWKPWGAWTDCDASCGTGMQTRMRECEHGFKQDRSKVPVTTCVENHSPETESRECDRGSCSSVSCSADEMKIEIPLEFGMTRQSVMERMSLKNADNERLCTPEVNDTHAVFVIPLHLCGTTTWVDGDIVFYSNVVEYKIDGQEESIIVREYGHSYTAKCQYQRRQTVALRTFNSSQEDFEEVALLKFNDDAQAFTGPDGDSLDMVTHYSSGDGAFEYRMDIYDDSSYSAPYTSSDYPLQKRLGERIFIAVDFKSQDEDLRVFIERCWAVSSGSKGVAYDDARYLFINGGCPTDPTVQFHNMNMTYFSDRYSIESFKFNDAEYFYIYFRCDVIVCDNSEDDPACYRECGSIASNGRQRRDISSQNRPFSRVTTQGPVVILDEDDFAKSRHWRYGGSSGSVEHKVLTFGDASVKRGKSQVNVEIREDVSFMNSPFTLPAIVGSICLLVGVSMGLLMRRRSIQKEALRNKSRNATKTATQRDESEEVMVKDC